MTVNNLRCEAYTMYNKVCKNKYKGIYNNTCLCLMHANIKLKKYILMIQKIWRGYKKRCYIKNFYTKLPDDIQYRIMELINEEVRTLQWNKSVLKIYYLNVNKIMPIDTKTNLISGILPRGRTNLNMKDYMEQINKIYKLSIKFILEIENNIIRDLVHYSQRIKFTLSPNNINYVLFEEFDNDLYKTWYELCLTIDTFIQTLKSLNY